MQTITGNSTGISYHLFPDSDTVTVGSNRTTVSTGEVIEDMRSDTHTLHTGVTAPSDWMGTKYKFDGTSWTLNTAYEVVCQKCLPDISLNDYDATKCSVCGESL